MECPRKIAIGFQEGTCPLRCAKCFAFGKDVKEHKKAEKMSMERAKHLIHEISMMEKVPCIQPHIYTEPFANQDLFEIIKECLDHNICMSIITNGILLDYEGIDFLIRSLDRRYTLSFSLDAVTQKTYEKVRGEYELKTLEKKIEYLISNRRDAGPRVGVNFSVEDDNYTEVNDFVEKWKYRVDAVRVNTAFTKEKKIPFRFKKESDKQHIACGYLDEVMTIDTNGEVRACQFDAFGKTSLGNVFEESILGIWNGEERAALRKKQSTDELNQDEFCFGCEIGMMTQFETYETEEFLIRKAAHSLYYNNKGEAI